MPLRRHVRDFMTSEVITVDSNMAVNAVAELLTEKHISGVPVVDAGDRIVGIVTEGDLVDRAKKVHMPTVITILDAVIPISGERQFEDDLRKMTGAQVKDIMSSPVTTIGVNATLQDAATLMSEEHVPLLPVVEKGEMVGILGKHDIILAMLAKQD